MVENTYCIYKHTSPSGKVYIGQTKNDIETRAGKDGIGYRPHGKHSSRFWGAIQKYGWDNFTHEVLERNLSLDEANEKEAYWIYFYDSTNRDKGYNIRLGGCNTPMPDEIKEKISKNHWSCKGSDNPMYGENIKDHMTEEKYNDWLDKIRHQSAEQIEKNRLAHTGENSVWFGKKHSCESILKMRESSPRKIKVCCIENGMVFNSVHDAARWCGGSSSPISKCCKGTKKTYKGFTWKYVDLEEAA